MTKELRVLVADEQIGSVFQRKDGKLTFVYDEAWRARNDNYPLSLSMPLTQAEHRGASITNYIWGLLSDDPDARSEMARRAGVSARSAFGLVAAYGEDLAGAVQMVTPEALDDLERRRGVTQISEKRLADFLAKLVKNPGQTQITPSHKSGIFSLPGAQAKKAICWTAGRWYEPRGRTPSTHIIKPPNPYIDGQVENEYFTSRLAASVGLRTAPTQVVQIDGTPNIVVERYDRVRISRGRQISLCKTGGTVHRVHQEDLCQAFGINPDNKYQRQGGPSIKRAMDLLAESGNPSVDRERFMRACMFNFVVLGVDAHGKNYSVLFEPGGRFRLAPLYDLISALPYDHEQYSQLAMKVGNEAKWLKIGPRHWEKEAKNARYSVDATLGFLRDLAERLPDYAQKLLREASEDGLDLTVLRKLVDALTKRCEKLRTDYAASVA